MLLKIKSLKVAHKVIIGFGVILLLLLFSSISSVGVLSDIKVATAKVDDFALPIEKYANTVQKQLLKQAKSSSLIATLYSVPAIEQLKTTFYQQGKTLQEQKKLIESMLYVFPTIDNLQHFNRVYQQYSESVEAIFTHRIAEIQQTQAFVEQQKKLADVLYEAGAILGDLSYLEDTDNPTQIERIIGSATQVEGFVFNLTDATKTILSITTMAEVEESQQIIEFAISNVEQYSVFLIDLGKEYNTEGLIEQFVDEFAKAKSMLRGEDNLFTLKLSQLEQRQALNTAINDSEQHISAAVTAIDVFLQALSKNLSNLQTDILESVEQGNLETIIVFIILFAVGVGIAITTISAMIGPLKGINKVLSQIAKGDLSRQLKVRSADEYGELSKNVNLVVADLRSLILNIANNTQSLNNAAEQSSEKIAQVTHSLATQQRTIEQATVQTQALGHSADHILAKANDAEHKMTSALQQSGELEATANTTNERMDNLVVMLDNTADVIIKLQQESTNISGILDTIRSISEQTNLLALNAAIEAARAGDAGRGFAVVADEVRLLASRTQESATEIQTMIEALQSQTKVAVVDIEQGKNEANHCQEHTKKLLQTLLSITSAIEQMHDMSADISLSATQQNSLSNDINDSIEAVVELSQQSSDKSSSTLAYSKQVADLATKLDDAIGAFKV